MAPTAIKVDGKFPLELVFRNQHTHKKPFSYYGFLDITKNPTLKDFYRQPAFEEIFPSISRNIYREERRPGHRPLAQSCKDTRGALPGGEAVLEVGRDAGRKMRE